MDPPPTPAVRGVAVSSLEPGANELPRSFYADNCAGAIPMGRQKGSTALLSATAMLSVMLGRRTSTARMRRTPLPLASRLGAIWIAGQLTRPQTFRLRCQATS